MRKLVSLLFVLSMLAGCHQGSMSEKLNEIDSLVAKEQYDSAVILLYDVAKAPLADEDQAHYNLLATQLGYVTNHPLESDSLLDLALNYYNKVGNRQKLADVYYYKSYRSEKDKNYPQAILFCKEAERLAVGPYNVRLQYKIAENLSYLNGLCENDLLQLQYAKKALKLAQKAKNGNWIVYSYNRISYAFYNLGQQDSAYIYVEKSIPYTNYVLDTDKAAFFMNIGVLYKEDNRDKAKEYFEKALTYGELPELYEHLADIYFAEDDKDEAYRLWKKALAKESRYKKDNLIYSILSYDIERGKLDEASKNLDEILAIKDSMLYLLKNDTIKDLQLRFDQEMAMHEADKKLISTQRMLIGLVILLGIMAVYILIRKRKEEALERAHQMQLYAYTTEINQLKASQENANQAEETIEKLNKKIKELLDNESPKLKQGRVLYDHIMEGGTTSKWDNKDEELFNNYFAATNFHVYNRLRMVERVSNLTPHRMFYLILKEIGKDDKKIMRIMGISPEGLRTLRSRTKPLNQN